MSITYPITLPSSHRMAVTFRPRAIVGVSMSAFTLQQQSQAHQGQVWAIHVQLTPMIRADAEPWIAALLSLNGMYGTFLLGDPSATATRGTAQGTPKVKGGSQTGQTLATDGWTATQTGVLLKGDWIQLGTGTAQRIYRVLTDTNADGAGEATLDIWPRLRESPADNENIIVSSTAGVFRLASNEMGWDVDNALIYGIEFDALEAI